MQEHKHVASCWPCNKISSKQKLIQPASRIGKSNRSFNYLHGNSPPLSVPVSILICLQAFLLTSNQCALNYKSMCVVSSYMWSYYCFNQYYKPHNPMLFNKQTHMLTFYPLFSCSFSFFNSRSYMNLTSVVD